MVRESLRRAPTEPPKTPPPYVGGALGGASAPTAPPQLPLRRGRDESPPCIERDHISPYNVITSFFHDINFV